MIVLFSCHLTVIIRFMRADD